MAEVRLQQVGKTFPNGTRAVVGADFTIADEEFVVLVGPSGCGKSTLLRMVAGLEEITEGQVSIGGRVVNALPPRERDVAMVFQNYALYPHMDVFDNMALGMRIRKEPRERIESEVREAARLLGIEGLLERRPAQLSGGQRQRVAVGRAIVRRPQLFLFDEPLSNLDAKMRVEMRTEISKLHHRLRATMLYVTHDQVEAMTMGDRIVVMKDGRVQQIDTPLGLYNRPANRFVASFVGSPPMNFWPARLRLSGGAALVVGDQELAIEGEIPPALEQLGEGEWTLGLRPEDFRLHRPADQPGPWARCEAPVEVVEPLGNETMVYWLQAGENTVARVRAGASVAVGQPLPLHLDLGHAHFFDPGTGEAKLHWPGREPSHP